MYVNASQLRGCKFATHLNSHSTAWTPEQACPPRFICLLLDCMLRFKERESNCGETACGHQESLVRKVWNDLPRSNRLTSLAQITSRLAQSLRSRGSCIPINKSRKMAFYLARYLGRNWDFSKALKNPHSSCKQRSSVLLTCHRFNAVFAPIWPKFRV